MESGGRPPGKTLVSPDMPGLAGAKCPPEGVGLIKTGDVLEVEIEGIGALRNRVVAEGSPAA